MRPRQSSLGITIRDDEAEAVPILSSPCFEAEAIKPRNAHRFNEAEAIKPRNHNAVHGGACFNEAEDVEPNGAPCFNEAEAIKPRNPCTSANEARPARPDESTPTRFNEAEAIKPRNLGTELRHEQSIGTAIKGPLKGKPRRASMRPRQSSLGIMALRNEAEASLRTCCFNEAEAIKPLGF